MDPHTKQVEQLFTAAAKATHFKEFRPYYFHNCVYDAVYHDAAFREPYPVEELLRSTASHYKLVLVGDALMAPYELVAPKSALFFGWEGRTTGLEWLAKLAQHFQRSVWLNPEPPKYWYGESLVRIAELFEMFPLTLEGIEAAVDRLLGKRGGSDWRPWTSQR